MVAWAWRVLVLVGVVFCQDDLQGSLGQRLQMEERLRQFLLQDYNKHILPYPAPFPNVVKYRITLHHLTMDESEQMLLADAWMVNEWMDERLSWDPREHNNIEKLTFPHDVVWKPDLDVYNSGRPSTPLTYGNTLLIVNHTGRVLFVPPVRLTFTCVMDLRLWPHDRHNCTMVVGSWIHDGSRIDPQLQDEKPMLELTSRQHEDGTTLSRGWWRLLDSNLTRVVKRYQCCPEPYITLHLSLLLARDAPAFSWTVKMPSIALSILTVVVFLLPPCAGEKLVFGGLCLILDVLFIAYTSVVIVHAPSHTPLIVELVCQQLFLTVVSVVVAALTTRLARDPHSSPLPPCVRTPLLLLSSCFCLHNYRNLLAYSSWEASRSPKFGGTIKTEEMEMGENSTSQLYASTTCPTSSSAASLDYILCAAFIDRLCLVIYIIIFVTNMLLFSEVL